jgi:AcrR family transcriptional regulator
MPAFDRSPRGRILAAAAAVVAHGGYRAATVERVLAKAHVTWADFTAEFESLEDCVLAAQSEALECAAAQAEKAADAVGPGAAPEAFDAALRRLLETISAHRELARLTLSESPSLGSAGIQRKEAGLQRFVALLQTFAAADGQVPALAAEMVVGGIYEILQRKVAAGELDRPADLAEELRRLWLPLVDSERSRI